MGLAIILAIGLTIAAALNIFRPDSSGGGFTEEDRWNLHCIWQRTITIMAQLDDLIGILSAVSSDVDTAANHLSQLESQLQNFQNSTPPEVDLSSAIALASNIRARLEGTQSNISNADTSTPPQTGDVQPGVTGSDGPTGGPAPTNFDEVAQSGEATTSSSVDGSEAGSTPTDGAPV